MTRPLRPAVCDRPPAQLPETADALAVLLADHDVPDLIARLVDQLGETKAKALIAGTDTVLERWFPAVLRGPHPFPFVLNHPYGRACRECFDLPPEEGTP